jgi:hypothetical protein
MYSHTPFPSVKKLADTLLVIGGGILCLVPAIYVMRLAGVITSIPIMLWILGGASILVGGFLTLIDNAQDLRLLGHKVVDCYKSYGHSHSQCTRIMCWIGVGSQEQL